jgi:hypothetical protein
VYYVTGRGVRRLKKAYAQQGSSWREGRVDRQGRSAQEGYGSDRLIHEILTTEFLLALWQTIQSRQDLKLLSVQRRSLAKHPAFAVMIGGKLSRLIPDALFVFSQQDQGMCCCFLELDNGTMNAKQIRRKFLRYENWTRSQQGQRYLSGLYQQHGAKDPRPAFRLLMVARSRTGQADDSRLAELLATAERSPSMICDRLWLTTVAALRERQQDVSPLAANVWLRANDRARKISLSAAGADSRAPLQHSLFRSASA